MGALAPIRRAQRETCWGVQGHALPENSENSENSSTTVCNLVQSGHLINWQMPGFHIEQEIMEYLTKCSQLWLWSTTATT